MKPVRSIAVLILMGAQVGAAEKPGLDWLAGYWCAQSGERSSEEYWLPARGGLMLGVNRSVTPKGAAFEFLRIEISEDATRYVAQPGGAPPTAFELVSVSLNQVTFANPAHDYPKRIHYAREGDRLTARTDAGAGDPKPQVFRWARCRD